MTRIPHISSVKNLQLLIIVAIPIAFLSGMAFAIFATVHTSNEPSDAAKSQVTSIAGSQDNGSAYAVVNPDTNRIYVANEVGKTISVIDGNTNAKIADIQLDAMPSKLAVNPNTNRIYVTEHSMVNNIEESSTVAVIDGNTNTEIASIHVGAYSQIAVNPNTNRIYVTEHHLVNNIEQNGTVSVIDGNTNTEIASIQVGTNPSGIAVNAETNHIYVIHRYHAMDNRWQNGTVDVIDGNTMEKTASIQVGINPAGISLNPDTNRIYVTNYNSGTISVIDGNTNDIVGKPIYLGAGVEGIDVNPLTNRIYVANGVNTTLYVIDGNTNYKVDEIRKLSAWSVAVNSDTDMIYVPSYFFNNLSAIDGRYDNVAAVIPIGTYPIK